MLNLLVILAKKNRATIKNEFSKKKLKLYKYDNVAEYIGDFLHFNKKVDEWVKGAD